MSNIETSMHALSDAESHRESLKMRLKKARDKSINSFSPYTDGLKRIKSKDYHSFQNTMKFFQAFQIFFGIASLVYAIIM